LHRFSPSLNAGKTLPVCISKDTGGIIRLTQHVLLPGHLSIDQLPQLAQSVGAIRNHPATTGKESS
jgi:hypothetical protein